MTTFSFTLPATGSGSSGELNAAQDRLYGKDLWFDLAAATGPNLVVDRTGDWLLATGLEALRQSLIRRLITSPGQWTTKPNYGAGLLRAVKRRNTVAERAQLEQRCREQCLMDRRVRSVDELRIERITNGLRINVLVIPRGQPAQARPLRVAFELTR